MSETTNQNLSGVSETLLVTLYLRCSVSESLALAPQSLVLRLIEFGTAVNTKFGTEEEIVPVEKGGKETGERDWLG